MLQLPLALPRTRFFKWQTQWDTVGFVSSFRAVLSYNSGVVTIYSTNIQGYTRNILAEDLFCLIFWLPLNPWSKWRLCMVCAFDHRSTDCVCGGIVLFIGSFWTFWGVFYKWSSRTKEYHICLLQLWFSHSQFCQWRR